MNKKEKSKLLKHISKDSKEFKSQLKEDVELKKFVKKQKTSKRAK